MAIITKEDLDQITQSDPSGGKRLKTDGVATVVGAVNIRDTAGNALTSTGGKLDVNSAPSVSSAATNTSVARNASSVTLLLANPNRKGATIVNNSSGGMFVIFAATATTSSFTAPIPANGYYEMPQPIYTGVIAGIWSNAGAGAALITELT
jgi:hypothetical protein